MNPSSQAHQAYQTYQFSGWNGDSVFGPKNPKNFQANNDQTLPKVQKNVLNNTKPLRERLVEHLGKFSNVCSGIAKVMLETAMNTLIFLGGFLLTIGSICYYTLEYIVAFLLLILAPAVMLLIAALSPLWTPVYCFFNREEG